MNVRTFRLLGVVYRARDPRLHRDVAIKVCTARFSERFSRKFAPRPV
jgi:hypothetical protein